jgi:hypothetical protein
MSPLFWTSYAVMWVLLVVLAVLLLLIYRQFGLMIMPGGQRISYGGLDIGAQAPVLPLRIGNRKEAAYDWSATDDGSAHEATFALFAMPNCPLCNALAGDSTTAVMTLSHPGVQFMWVDGGREPSHSLPAPWITAFSSHGEAHSTMEIPGTPFAYLISPGGEVIAKGLINDPADIEMMLGRALARQASGAYPLEARPHGHD